LYFSITFRPIPQSMMINFESLEEWANGDIGTMKEIIHLFLENTPPALLLLKHAIDTQDWGQIVKHAHKLKSSYGIVTISNSLTLIQGIEHSGLEKTDLERVHTDFQTVLEQYGAAAAELDAFIKANP
jgi:HPt (histidine-containing phosphotransfer) domain-containing protein